MMLTGLFWKHKSQCPQRREDQDADGAADFHIGSTGACALKRNTIELKAPLNVFR